MSNVAAGTVWNLPNYIGEIFTASSLQTPFLSMIGGMTGGGMTTTNFEFPTAQNYDHESASQPSITETASLTAPTAISYVRAQTKNVCQIHQEQIALSYARVSTQGRLSGISTSGASNPVADELNWQVSVALDKIRRDIEYSFIQGAYQISTDATTANTTRGINAAAAISTTIAASSATLSKALLQQLFRTMYAAGAVFNNVVLIVNAFQKQKISEIYGYAPTDRNIGGLNIKQIETDFGNIGVVLDAFQSTSVVCAAEVSVCTPVHCPVPSKGNFFLEPLSKTGASEKYQIYGQIGLDYGPTYYHGSITGLATS